MKTTINISDAIFQEAWKVAEKRGTTFKEIVERALSLFLKKEKGNSKPFKMKWHTFKGKGLVEGLHEGDWTEIRRRIYEGRGG